MAIAATLYSTSVVDRDTIGLLLYNYTATDPGLNTYPVVRSSCIVISSIVFIAVANDREVIIFSVKESIIKCSFYET